MSGADGKRYAARVGMTLGFSNCCCAATEWLEVTPAPARPITIQYSEYW